MGCSEPIVLQRLLDGDLDDAHDELVSHHIDSCAECRAAVTDLAAQRVFVQDHLGIEDEGEDDGSAAALGRIASRLPGSRAPRWSWLAAAALIIIVLLPALPFSRAGAHPTKILDEAVARERMWMYQPNRALHWEVETVSKGVKNTADGQWRTLFWQKNGATSFAQITRQVDPQGRIERAYWQQPDGSSINFRPKERVLEMWPSSAVAREALPNLSPDLRTALESFLARRETNRTLDFNSRRHAEWLQRPAWSGGSATLRRSWGEVYRIRVVNDKPKSSEIRRAVHEYEIEKSTFRPLRLKSTITYADGTAGVHDSRWVAFRETSGAEFDAQTPRGLLETGIPVVQLTPREVAERRLKEMKGF